MSDSGSKIVTIAASLILAGAALSYFKSDESTQPVAINLMVGCAAIAATNELISSHYIENAKLVSRNVTAKTDTILRVSESFANKHLTAFQELEILYKNKQNQHQKESEHYQETIDILTTRIRVEKISNDYEKDRLRICEEELEVYRKSLELLFNEHRELLIIELANRVNHHLNLLINSINAQLNLKNRHNMRAQMEAFKEKVNFQISGIRESLADMKGLERFDFLLEDFANNLEIISKLKVQFKNLLGSRERDACMSYYIQLQNCVPKEKAVNIIKEQSNNQKSQLTQIFDGTFETDQQVQLLKVQMEDLVNQIESKNLEISTLKQPVRWSLATRQDLQIGNIIINYFQAMNIILDRSHADFKTTDSTLYFHIDRNSRRPIPSEFNQHSEKLQMLCHTLSPITFAWDAESGLLEAKLQLSKKPQKTRDEDIARLWKISDQFESIIKSWERIRITGQSQAGKSPTAENIAVCVMKHRKDAGDIELYNPQHDSVKNHFSVPVTGTTHKDSVQALLVLAETINKQQSDRTVFDFHIFDEIDSTLTHDKSCGESIKSIIKQASHQNIGCIFTGQNANARQYPGFDRSDFNNVVNVHIGQNAYDAISNSNQFTSDQLANLKSRADKISEYCQVKNTELGLESFDPSAYRFALVLEPGKTPYFLQLPDFGKYTYDQLEVSECPSCGSENIIKHGKGRLKCSDCAKTFKS